MKKVIALIITAVFLFLTGCENVQYEISDQSGENSVGDVYVEIESQLPQPEQETIEIKPFLIATNSASTFYQEENAVGTISAAIIERNNFIKDKYGAEIVTQEYEPDAFVTELKNATLAEQRICDMISMPAETTVKLYAAGLLMDMNTLPEFDLNGGLFDGNFSKSLATNQSLYLLADPTTLVYDDTHVMFYNESICPTPENSESIETLVMQGKWTWDKFSEYQKLAAAVVYKQGAGSIKEDIFGFGAYEEKTTYPLVQWVSCGNKVIDNTYNNPVEISMALEEISPIASYLRKGYLEIGRYPLDGEEAREAFEDNRLAFFSHKLKYFYALRDGNGKGNNYKFIPMPKYNEEQENYACLISNDASVISVPAIIATKDQSYQKYVSNTISAICAIGNKTMQKAYVNSLLALYLNTNEETVMLNTICDSATFDFATVYGLSIKEIGAPTSKAIANFIDYGSNLSKAFDNGSEAFKEYCAEHFNPIPSENQESEMPQE